MSKCGNCGGDIDLNAAVCPRCGRPDPGAGERAMMGIITVIVLAVLLFLSPAVIRIWPFVGGLGDAVSTAIGSVWAWLASGAFWGVLVVIIVKKKHSRSLTSGTGASTVDAEPAAVGAAASSPNPYNIEI